MFKSIALLMTLLVVMAGNSFAQTANGTTTFTLFAGGDTGGSADTIYAADVASRYIDTQCASSVTIWCTLDSAAGTNPAWYPQVLVSCDASTWDTLNISIDSLEAESDRVVLRLFSGDIPNSILGDVVLPVDSAFQTNSVYMSAAAAAGKPYLLNYLKLFWHETVAGGTCGVKAKAIVRGWGTPQIHGTQPY